MRRIERTKKFKLDYKRERKGRHRAVLGTALAEALFLLTHDRPWMSVIGIMPWRGSGTVIEIVI